MCRISKVWHLHDYKFNWNVSFGHFSSSKEEYFTDTSIDHHRGGYLADFLQIMRYKNTLNCQLYGHKTHIYLNSSLEMCFGGTTLLEPTQLSKQLNCWANTSLLMTWKRAQIVTTQSSNWITDVLWCWISLKCCAFNFCPTLTKILADRKNPHCVLGIEMGKLGLFLVDFPCN